MNELRFDGQTVIVTGAGRGIGRGHALLLAARGARVVVADVGGAVEGGGSSSGPADEVVGEIKAGGGNAIACCASVATADGAASIVKVALEAYGRVDAIINNAGISAPDPFDDLKPDDFQRMIDVHYMGTMHVIKAAWPHMKAAGYGRIVNTVSEAMVGIHPMVTSYGGAKGGVFGLTRTLASESQKHGILVNAVAPRAFTRMSGPETISKVMGIPASMVQGVQKMAPEQVAPAAAFLAHESCKLNGEVLVSGGGQVQRMAVAQSKGIYSPQLTPEVIAGELDTLLDMTGAQFIDVNFALKPRRP